VMKREIKKSEGMRKCPRIYYIIAALIQFDTILHSFSSLDQVH
jgi:hypothetical protein